VQLSVHHMSSPVKLLVVGECGDGKSTLIKHFASSGQVPEVGMRSDGVTKGMKTYSAGVIGGRQVFLIDSPGVGDKDIKPGQLVAMIEAFLNTETGLHGVLMCNKIVGSRVTLGARVLALLAEKGFQGASKWEDFVYVGTQKDRCTNAEIEHFKTETLESLNRGCGGSIRSAVTISINENDPSRTDVTELVEAIARMRGHTVSYVAPNPRELSAAIGDLMNIPPEVIEREIVIYRGGFWQALVTFATLGAVTFDERGEPRFFGM
jgi:GTP-binding protein EngB required for normal cell division